MSVFRRISLTITIGFEPVEWCQLKINLNHEVEKRRVNKITYFSEWMIYKRSLDHVVVRYHSKRSFPFGISLCMVHRSTTHSNPSLSPVPSEI